jgi:signal transduction histidine kinase
VYFCTLEALQNVAKYADATHATVRLANGVDGLTFEVSDDGVRFDPSATTYGTGLQGVADRLAALGGTLKILSARGRGTTILGSVPANGGPSQPAGRSIG